VLEKQKLIIGNLTKTGNWNWSWNAKQIFDLPPVPTYYLALNFHNNAPLSVRAMTLHIAPIDRDYLLSAYDTLGRLTFIGAQQDGILTTGINEETYNAISHQHCSASITRVWWGNQVLQ